MEKKNEILYLIAFICFLCLIINQKVAFSKEKITTGRPDTAQPINPVFIPSNQGIDIYQKVDEIKDVSFNEHIKINIKNISCSLKITGWSKNQIKIKGKLYANNLPLFFPPVNKDKERYTLKTKENLTEFKVLLPSYLSEYTEIESNKMNYDSPLFNALQFTHFYNSNLEIYIPEQSLLSVTAFDSGIEIQNINSNIQVNSSFGAILVNEVTADTVILNSVKGQISFSGTAQKLEAESISGPISISGNVYDLMAHTVDSSITYSGKRTSRINILTIDGDIDINCSLNKNANVNLNSSNGDVDLKIPFDTSAMFSLNSKNQKINYSNFQKKSGLKKEDIIEKQNGIKNVSFTTGSGDGNIIVWSFNGPITLKVK